MLLKNIIWGRTMSKIKSALEKAKEVLDEELDKATEEIKKRFIGILKKNVKR